MDDSSVLCAVDWDLSVALSWGLVWSERSMKASIKVWCLGGVAGRLGSAAPLSLSLLSYYQGGWTYCRMAQGSKRPRWKLSKSRLKTG